eukprot:9132202-Heterocapsa_arctica.AAC.1
MYFERMTRQAFTKGVRVFVNSDRITADTNKVVHLNSITRGETVEGLDRGAVAQPAAREEARVDRQVLAQRLGNPQRPRPPHG